MHKLLLKNPSQIVQILSLAVGITLVAFLWQGYRGFDLWDEGFFWYGVQRVMLGEVPIRDFMAYDLGRYYWAAGLMTLWRDDSVIALRVTAAAFQAIGVFIGLALLFRNTRSSHLLWLLAAITLTLWMFPWYKVFDTSSSIVLIGILSFLVQKPSGVRYFLAGLCLGFIAVFGRNHGMYGVAASLGIMVYLTVGGENRLGPVKTFMIWAMGVVIGYLPVLIMIAVVPGFASAFWESIRFLFEVKATNLPLPVPWPWRVAFGAVPPLDAARGIVLGILFIAIAVFGVLGIAWVVYQKLKDKPVSSVVLSSAFLALPYAHYAYSRADFVHLAQGIFPFLIGSFALLASGSLRTKWVISLLLAGGSVFVMLPMQPGWACRKTQQCIDADVAGSKLKISPNAVVELDMLHKLDEQFANGGRNFIVTPFWPGAYAVLKRKSPMWEIYALFPRSVEFERAEIERIKIARPRFAMIIDVPLDGRDELRFHNTHPQINQYIHDHFKRVEGYTPSSAFQLYIEKQVTQ